MAKCREYTHTGYVFDPATGTYRKSKFQYDVSLSNHQPAIIRIERNKSLQISASLVLTYQSGYKWILITGLTPVPAATGYYVGNQVIKDGTSKKKTAMVIIHTDIMAGTLDFYLFPDYDEKSVSGRCKSAKDFIKHIRIEPAKKGTNSTYKINNYSPIKF